MMKHHNLPPTVFLVFSGIAIASGLLLGVSLAEESGLPAEKNQKESTVSDELDVGIGETKFLVLDEDEVTISLATDNSLGCQPNCLVNGIISVKPGTRITFLNTDSSPQTFSSGDIDDSLDGAWDSGLVLPGQSFQVTLDTPGTYRYFSKVSPWIEGSITVGATSVNLPPTADAGQNQTVDEQTLVRLSGSVDDPEDGKIRYGWKQISGPPVFLLGSNFAGAMSKSLTTYFLAPDVRNSTILTFQLTAKDDTLQYRTDTVSVAVNPTIQNTDNIPTVDTSPDQTSTNSERKALLDHIAALRDKESGLSAKKNQKEPTALDLALEDAKTIIGNFLGSSLNQATISNNTVTYDLPINLIFVNKTSQELVIGLDSSANMTEQYYAEQIESLIGSDIPIKLFRVIFNPTSGLDLPTLPPLQQIAYGIDPKDVKCRDGRILFFKTPEHPVCMYEKSIEKYDSNYMLSLHWLYGMSTEKYKNNRSFLYWNLLGNLVDWDYLKEKTDQINFNNVTYVSVKNMDAVRNNGTMPILNLTQTYNFEQSQSTIFFDLSRLTPPAIYDEGSGYIHHGDPRTQAYSKLTSLQMQTLDFDCDDGTSFSVGGARTEIYSIRDTDELRKYFEVRPSDDQLSQNDQYTLYEFRSLYPTQFQADDNVVIKDIQSAQCTLVEGRFFDPIAAEHFVEIYPFYYKYVLSIEVLP